MLISGIYSLPSLCSSSYLKTLSSLQDPFLLFLTECTHECVGGAALRELPLGSFSVQMFQLRVT